MKDLENKNIIVTGASGGIGNSIVEKLNKCGANVLASGTRLEKLEELKNKFNRIKILKFDISQIENRVRWRESEVNIVNKGVNQFIEIGPGKVLSGLVKRINKEVLVSSINSEEEIKDIKL